MAPRHQRTSKAPRDCSAKTWKHESAAAAETSYPGAIGSTCSSGETISSYSASLTPPYRLKSSSADTPSYRAHDASSSCRKSAQHARRPMAEARSASVSGDDGSNSASSAVSSGAGSSSATRCSAASGESGGGRMMAGAGDAPGPPALSTGATATLPVRETRRVGVKGVRTSSASSPSESSTASVLRYSLQKPWMPASTGRPPGVRQPAARPPAARGEASSSVTRQSDEAERASAAA